MLSKLQSQRGRERGRQAKHIVAKRSQRISESLAKWAEAVAAGSGAVAEVSQAYVWRRCGNWPPVKKLPHVATLWNWSPACCVFLLLPAANCGLLCLLPPGSACVRKTPAPVSAMLAGCRRHSTCICIFKLRFVCGLPLGCVYTRIADRRGCASLSIPRTPPHSFFFTLSFATLFVHLALNSCAFQRFCRWLAFRNELHQYVAKLHVHIPRSGTTATTSRRASSLDLPNATWHPLWADSRQAWLQIWL